MKYCVWVKEFCVTELYLFLCMKCSENVCSYIYRCKLTTVLSTKSSFQAVSVVLNELTGSFVFMIFHFISDKMCSVGQHF